MSQENVELVRPVLAEFGASRAGIEGAARVGLVAPDVEFDFSALYPDGPILHGLEAWRGFASTLPWGSMTIEPERFFDVDDQRVLVLMRVTAEGEGSRVPVETRTAQEFTIRDGILCVGRAPWIRPRPSKPPGWRSRTGLVVLAF